VRAKWFDAGRGAMYYRHSDESIASGQRPMGLSRRAVATRARGSDRLARAERLFAEKGR